MSNVDADVGRGDGAGALCRLQWQVLRRGGSALARNKVENGSFFLARLPPRPSGQVIVVYSQMICGSSNLKDDLVAPRT